MAELRQLFPDTTPFPQDDDENGSFANFMTNFQNGNELQDILENERGSLRIDEGIREQIYLSPSEVSSLTQEVIHDDDFVSTFEEVTIADVEGLGQDRSEVDDFLATLDVTCEECVTFQKAKEINQIQPGDHIRFHRKKLGINWYNHHAIVTDVRPSSSDVAVGELTLVHFQKNEGSTFSVLRKTEKINLRSESIDKAKYQNRPLTTQEIVDRANEMADKFARNEQAESYSFFGNNCEDKSNEIATGVKFSQQVVIFAIYVKSTIAWFLKLMLKAAIKFCDKMKPFIRGFAHVSVIASLLSLVDHLVSLKNKLKRGLICLKCYKREHGKLMISLLFCLITIGVSVTSHVSWFYFAVSTVIAAALPFLSSIFMDTIMPLIHPASNIPKPIVRRGNMIKPGDVITFPYIKLYHQGVVTKVNPNVVGEDSVKVTVVHFNYPGMFGTRTVIKDDIFFNLRKEAVYVYDFSGETVFPPEDVVRKALDQIGSQDFSMFSNRSSHVSRYCKTGQKELKSLPYRKASVKSDLSPGDVIDFTYCGLSHEGVVVQVQYQENVKCSVIHYNYAGIFGTRSIVEEEFNFSLSEQNLFVHDYSGCDIYGNDEVVRRARSRLGEEKFNTFTNRSSHFAKWCKIKQ